MILLEKSSFSLFSLDFLRYSTPIPLTCRTFLIIKINTSFNIINFFRLFLFIKLNSTVSNNLYPLLQKDSKFYFLNLRRKLIPYICLLYTSDAADEGLGVDLGGRRIIKKKFFLFVLLSFFKVFHSHSINL